jgi:enoyl-CoA hydratase/carnithine racemase
MIFKTICLDIDQGIAVVTLNRPREMNALTIEMTRELEGCFSSLEQDGTVRVIVVTGGDYVFSAGMDLKEMAGVADEEIREYFRSIASYLKKIQQCPKPVIAAVGGIALGGGFNLAAVCDLIIASESAIFGHPELRFGLNPLFYPLQQRVGIIKAKEINMLGEPIGAGEALRIGLVNKVLPPEKMMEGALEMARELAKRFPEALEAIKRISDIVPRLDRGAAMDFEMGVEALLFSSEKRKIHMGEFIQDLKNRKKQPS